MNAVRLTHLFRFIVLLLGAAPLLPAAGPGRTLPSVAPAPSTEALEALRAAAAAQPEDFEARLRHGVALFDLATSGVASALDTAIAELEAAVALAPEHPLALAYLGCALTLRADRVGLLEKNRWVQRGFQRMDRAVELAPNDAVVRLIRGVNSYHVPRFLGRRHLAETDLGLVAGWASDPASGLPSPLRRLALFHAGAYAARYDPPAAPALLAAARTHPGPTPPNAEIEAALARAVQRAGTASRPSG